MRVRVFKLCVYLQRVKVYCLQVNQDAIIYFAFFFPFFLFSISHSNVIHREICIEDFQKLLHLGNLVQTLDTTTLQCRYYAVPYNAETVITRLVCGSHFLCSISPILKVLPFFRGNQQSKRSLISRIYTFCFTKVVICILPFGYFRHKIGVIFFIHLPGHR